MGRHRAISDRDPTRAAVRVRTRGVASTGDVAAILRVNTHTVLKAIDRGDLKGFCIPGSAVRRVYADDLVAFLLDRGIRVPRELMCGCRVTYGMTLPAPVPGWENCDAFQLGELCSTKPILAAVLGDEWGVAAAVKAAEHIRRNNPDAVVVFVLDPSNAAAAVPGEVRVRGEVELGELLGAL